MSNLATRSIPHLRRSGQGRPLWHWLVAAAGALVLVVVAAFGYIVWRMNDVPVDLDLSTTRFSEQGLYSSTIRPDLDPILVNKLHSWTLHVATADGQPIEGATITVDGDMPQHGHGMPTQPLVTQELGGGNYLVEGMKFQMGGWWVIDFTVTANGSSDKVSFNLLLQN